MLPSRFLPSLSICLVARVLAVVLLGTHASSAADDDSLGHAVLRYRMQVYESYRLSRPELDRHLETGYALISDWRDRGSPREEVDELIDWFQRATRAVRMNRAGGLPEYDYVSADAIAAPEHSAPAQPTRASTMRATDGSTVNRDARGIGQMAPNPVRSAPSSLSSSAVSRAPRAAEVRRRPPVPDAAPDDLPPLNPADVVPERPVESSTFVADQLPRVRLQLTPPRETFVHSVPLSPAPATPLSPNPTTARATATANVQTDVNLEVLSAKIRSTNLSLTAIEGELAASSTWTVEQLETVAQDLSRLLGAAELARMYYDALSDRQRRDVEPPLDDGPIQAILAQRLFETRVRLSDRAETAPSPELDRQRDRLEALFHKIQRWNGDDLQ